MIHHYNFILHILPICVQFHFTLCIQGGCFLHRDRNEIGQSLATQQVVQFEGLNWGFKDVFCSVLVCWCQFSHCFLASGIRLARFHGFCVKHLKRKTLRFENYPWETCILHQTKEIQGQPSVLATPLIAKLKCHAACLDPLPAPVAWGHCSGIWHHVLSCHGVGMLSQSFMIFRVTVSRE